VEKRGGKLAQKDWKRRYLVISNSSVRYLTKPGGDVKGVIEASEVQGAGNATNLRGRQFVFEISTPERNFVIDAGSEAERKDWLLAIKELKARKAGKPAGSVLGPTGSSTPSDGLPFTREVRSELHAPFGRDASFTGTGQTVAASAATRRAWDWSVNEVVQWLKALPLQGDLSSLIEQGKVDGETLVDELKTAADWIDLGVPAIAHADLKTLVTAAQAARTR